MAPVVGVSPGAAYGTAKRWLPERFAEAAVETARAQGGSVAFFGSAGERELCQTVAQMVTQAGVAGHNLAGATTLKEFIELAAACRVFLTNDSGAMHIASALGVPTVAVFGATDDSTTGPTGALARVVREPVECSPACCANALSTTAASRRIRAARVAEVALGLLR
jgi:heptosyltransferase-2